MLARTDEHLMPDVASTPAPKVVAKPHNAEAPKQGLKRTTRVKPKPHPAAVATPIPYVSPFAIGDHISHPQFGEGTVTEIEGAKLTIDFASRGTKQIIDDYVKRSKVE
jgi:Protein of unknown function (DUF3553)